MTTQLPNQTNSFQSQLSWTLYSISHHPPLPFWNILFTWLLWHCKSLDCPLTSQLHRLSLSWNLDRGHLSGFLWSLFFRSWVGRRKHSCSCSPSSLLACFLWVCFSTELSSPHAKYVYAGMTASVSSPLCLFQYNTETDFSHVYEEAPSKSAQECELDLTMIQ